MGQCRNSRWKTTGLRLRDLPVNRSGSPVLLRVPRCQPSGDNLADWDPLGNARLCWGGNRRLQGKFDALAWHLLCFNPVQTTFQPASLVNVSNCLLWRIALPWFFHPESVLLSFSNSCLLESVFAASQMDFSGYLLRLKRMICSGSLFLRGTRVNFSRQWESREWTENVETTSATFLELRRKTWDSVKCAFLY